MVEINIRNGCCESALRFIGSQNIESCLSESRGQYPGSYAEKNPFDHSVPENHLFNNCAVPVIYSRCRKEISRIGWTYSLATSPGVGCRGVMFGAPDLRCAFVRCCGV